jgi:hypothetical protein
MMPVNANHVSVKNLPAASCGCTSTPPNRTPSHHHTPVATSATNNRKKIRRPSFIAG